MSAAASTEQTDSDQPELKRVMGPRLLLLFIVGDILGAGVYAVTGDIAGEVGGVAWLPFLIAFTVATLTAFSYLELVTKYPHAAGAALYTHKAFGIHFVTFLVAFTVVCSGITSASTSSNLLAANLLAGLDDTIGGVPTSTTATVVVALSFMVVLALINLRGVGESVKFNVVLTMVEIVALAIVILIGFYAMATKGVDLGQVVAFENANDRGMFAAVTVATAIAFFSMVGFEDSVNMVEETKDPEKIFPRTMLTGLGIAVVIYMLVAVSVVMVLPLGDIQDFDGETGILLEVVKAGAPGLPGRLDLPLPDRLRRRQHRSDQHADGQPADLRHGPTGRAAPIAGQGAPRSSYAVGRHRVHHAARPGPDPGGDLAGGELDRRVARRHDGAAAAGGLHHRQRRLPGAAQGHLGHAHSSRRRRRSR